MRVATCCYTLLRTYGAAMHQGSSHHSATTYLAQGVRHDYVKLLIERTTSASTTLQNQVRKAHKSYPDFQRLGCPNACARQHCLV